MVQLRHDGFHVRPDLLGGPILIRHMLGAEVDQLLLAAVPERSAGIAPFAVFLVERAVRLMAGRGALKRHTAALADKLPRRPRQRIDGNVKNPGEPLERFRVRRRLAVLPAGHRLP